MGVRNQSGFDDVALGSNSAIDNVAQALEHSASAHGSQARNGQRLTKVGVAVQGFGQSKMILHAGMVKFQIPRPRK